MPNDGASKSRFHQRFSQTSRHGYKSLSRDDDLMGG